VHHQLQLQQQPYQPKPQQSKAQSSCLFIGCTCGRDSSVEIFDSNEDAAQQSNNAALPATVSYEITCRDETHPDNLLSMFPKRDDSRKFSNYVTTFDLATHSIKQLPDDRLAGLIISLLDLSDNQISAISPNAFQGASIETLELKRNKLETLGPETFESLGGSLVSLELNHNSLDKTETRVLNIIFARLVKLRNLNLGFNKLTRAPDLSKLAHLANLNLVNNHIETLLDPVTGHSLLPSSLNNLNLEHNHLTEIDESTFGHLKHLKHLSLQHNRISQISEKAFAHMGFLINLNLAKNNIKHIPSRVFYTLVKLERLDLSSQMLILGQIDDYAFDRQSSANPIKKIDLSQNHINRTSERAFCSRNRANPYVNVNEIDLSHNRLARFNPCIMRQLTKGHSAPSPSAKPSSTIVVVKTNPFVPNFVPIACDCSFLRDTSNLVKLEGQCNKEDTRIEFSKHVCPESGSLTAIRERIDQECQSTQPNTDCRNFEHAEATTAQYGNNGDDDDSPSSRPTKPGSKKDRPNTQNDNVRPIQNNNLNSNHSAQKTSSFSLLIITTSLTLLLTFMSSSRLYSSSSS
jgi:Leucine-rich repeat (LRR) protein